MSKDESEEEDYMSDAILPKGNDIRPGLLSKTTSMKYRNQERMKILNEKSKTKPLKVLEHEKREEGLNKTISPENKGFALLQRMGYKPGMALGKKNEGRSEPVPIEIKSGRGGLGRENEMKRKQQERDNMRAYMARKRHKRNEENSRDYRVKIKNKFLEKKAEADLYKSQKVCEQLDSEQGLKEPCEVFFWPVSFQIKKKREMELKELEEGYDFEVHEEKEEDAKEGDTKEDMVEDTGSGVQLSVAEQLEVLTTYLRNRYLYCVWCGISYNDKADLKSNCPGDTADHHS